MLQGGSLGVIWIVLVALVAAGLGFRSLWRAMGRLRAPVSVEGAFLWWALWRHGRQKPARSTTRPTTRPARAWHLLPAGRRERSGDFGRVLVRIRGGTADFRRPACRNRSPGPRRHARDQEPGGVPEAPAICLSLGAGPVPGPRRPPGTHPVLRSSRQLAPLERNRRAGAGAVYPPPGAARRVRHRRRGAGLAAGGLGGRGVAGLTWRTSAPVARPGSSPSLAAR